MKFRVYSYYIGGNSKNFIIDAKQEMSVTVQYSKFYQRERMDSTEQVYNGIYETIIN